MPGKRLTVWIGEELQKRLKRQAALSKRPSSELVREALVEYLDKKGSQRSCYDLAADAGIVGMVKNAPRDLSTNRRYFDPESSSVPERSVSPRLRTRHA